MCCTYSQALYQLTIEQIFRMKIHYTVCIRLQTFGGDGGAHVRRLNIHTYRTSAVVESDCIVSDAGLETGFLRHQVDSNRPRVFRSLLYYILWLAGQ